MCLNASNRLPHSQRRRKKPLCGRQQPCTVEDLTPYVFLWLSVLLLYGLIMVLMYEDDYSFGDILPRDDALSRYSEESPRRNWLCCGYGPSSNSWYVCRFMLRGSPLRPLAFVADRDNLPYVNAILNETLRWQPVTPTGMRHNLDMSPKHSPSYRSPAPSTEGRDISRVLHSRRYVLDTRHTANPLDCFGWFRFNYHC